MLSDKDAVFSSGETFPDAIVESVSKESSIPTDFDVRFGPGMLGNRTALPNCFSWRGKGQLHITNQGVLISGKRARPFWFGVPEEHLLSPDEICNARASGKTIFFSLESADARIRLVTFAATSNEEAVSIVSQLPTRQTEAFKRDNAEQSDFNRRLNTLSPTAIVTPILIALNILMFLLMALNGAGFFVPNSAVAVEWGTNFGPLTMSGQWWRLFTSAFIHFGVIHIAFNMFALYQTGVLVERMYGSFYFLILYVFAGLSGSLVSVLWHPYVNSAGASGAIFGVFGGLLAFMMNSRTQVPKSIVTAHRNSTLGFIGYNLLNGFGHAGIDNGAHLGGLLGGVAIGFLLARPLEENARSNPARRAFLAVTVGAFILGFTIYALFPSREAAHQELAFQQALDGFADKEKKAVSDFQAIVGPIEHANRLSQAAAAHPLEQTVLPQWEALHDSLAKATLDKKSRRLGLQQALLVYCDDREKHLRLLIAALRAGDADLYRQASAAANDVKAQVAVVSTLIKGQ